MKQARVRLMKQMKVEGDKFRQWKAEKDKEVLQLKAKDRKRQCEFSKLTQRHEKQENVLRRKMEEVRKRRRRVFHYWCSPDVFSHSEITHKTLPAQGFVCQRSRSNESREARALAYQGQFSPHGIVQGWPPVM